MRHVSAIDECSVASASVEGLHFMFECVCVFSLYPKKEARLIARTPNHPQLPFAGNA